MTRPTTTWKANERKRAEKWGGQRIPASGNGSIKGDIRLEHVLLEDKYGNQVPKTLYKWHDEAMRDAVTESTNRGSDEPLVPVVTVTRPRARTLVIINEDDFLPIARRAGVIA